MMGSKRLVALLSATALLMATGATPAPASAVLPAAPNAHSSPASASGAPAATSAARRAAARPAYKHYVACGDSEGAAPARSCPKSSKKGAFFKSLRADVFYSVCVRFPTGRSLCARHEKAQQGTLYVNRITSHVVGKHMVTWFVAGTRVGRTSFFVRAR